MSRRKVEIRKIAPDHKYNSVEVMSLINHLMLGGKKSTAETIVYKAFAKLESDGLNALETYMDALKNIKPFWNLRYRRIGGSTCTVPRQASTRQAESKGVKNLVSATRGRSGTQKMYEKLYMEIKDAIIGKGSAVGKKEENDKTAKANQAFMNLNW